jgi:hypothetical protein
LQWKKWLKGKHNSTQSLVGATPDASFKIRVERSSSESCNAGDHTKSLEKPEPVPIEDIEPAPKHLQRPAEGKHKRSLSRSSQRQLNPLGLNIVYSPPSRPTADLIFIHGLNGSSHSTWSKDGEPELFWPQKFLPFEPEMCNTRISTFGYNSSILGSDPGSNLSITDFAKNLLFCMKFTKTESPSPDIGQVRSLMLLPQ